MAHDDWKTCTVLVDGQPCGKPSVRVWWTNGFRTIEAECKDHDSEHRPGVRDRRTGRYNPPNITKI